eukprot:GHVN01007488.1.p1 GENE.GHVN01007488.1~~GHVN01007488.1.p1  ORF type:complete len:137 (+),score=2.00 GHVN01007488.1:254-664(+)
MLMEALELGLKDSQQPQRFRICLTCLTHAAVVAPKVLGSCAALLERTIWGDAAQSLKEETYLCLGTILVSSLLRGDNLDSGTILSQLPFYTLAESSEWWSSTIERIGTLFTIQILDAVWDLRVDASLAQVDFTTGS